MWSRVVQDGQVLAVGGRCWMHFKLGEHVLHYPTLQNLHLPRWLGNRPKLSGISLGYLVDLVSIWRRLNQHPQFFLWKEHGRPQPSQKVRHRLLPSPTTFVALPFAAGPTIVESRSECAPSPSTLRFSCT